jgi:hypothetical protein
MTPLQNDPQQQQCEAKNRKCRVPHGVKRIPDSESAHGELSKSGLDFEKNEIWKAGVGDHFRSASGAVWNSCRASGGGGTTTGAQK